MSTVSEQRSRRQSPSSDRLSAVCSACNHTIRRGGYIVIDMSAPIPRWQVFHRHCVPRFVDYKFDLGTHRSLAELHLLTAHLLREEPRLGRTDWGWFITVAAREGVLK